MITPAQLYAASSDGLAILEIHFPDIRKVADTNKHFRFRPGERTPSATCRRWPLKEGGWVYKVKDFGGDMHDPISVHMQRQGLNFAEAVLDLAERFKVVDETTRPVNCPELKKYPALPEQEDGKCYWQTDQDFTEKECSVMGPRVKAEHLKALGWHRVNVFTMVKGSTALEKRSTPNYPIFMRECRFTGPDGKQDTFYKFYEPLNKEKRYRFQYQPAGKKPQDYINGLAELKEAYDAYNDKAEKDWYLDPKNADKPFVPVKLERAIICSGERDALCVRSLGYFPLWFNSETYDLKPEEWQMITQYVDKVHNIPDLDETGRKRGIALALKYMDIYTIWLPEWLRNYRDHRGNPRKDFRDWMDLRSTPHDFKNLLEGSVCARFWTKTVDEKTNKTRYEVSMLSVLEFLKLHGFGRLEDTQTGELELVQVSGCFVSRTNTRRIRNFILNWAASNGALCPSALRERILTNKNLASNSITDLLPELTLDFTHHTPDSQTFFLTNETVTIDKEGIKTSRPDDAGSSYVWEDRIIPHRFRKLPDMFNITHEGDKFEDSETFDIEILPHSSKFFNFLTNTSRHYWREELETYADTLTEEEREEYLRKNKFVIDGPALTPDQIKKQKLSLLNKIFVIGYCLHRYKIAWRPWSPFLMDDISGGSNTSYGGTGKSIMINSLKHVLCLETIDCRKNGVAEDNFLFGRVSKNTDLVYMDDCHRGFPFADFYNKVSGDLYVNPKHLSPFSLPYSQAPKICLSTNFVPTDFDPSSMRRLLFVSFADYYHQMSPDTDYRESRSVNSDFGKDLFSESYTDEEWNADINFLFQCCRFYLSVKDTRAKIQPDMKNILYRKWLSEISENFLDWAEVYFSRGSDNVDNTIRRDFAFQNYKDVSGNYKTTMQGFNKQLKAFCKITDYITDLNPAYLHTSGDRILQYVYETDGTKVKKEMIHISTIDARPRTPEVEQPEIPW